MRSARLFSEAFGECIVEGVAAGPGASTGALERWEALAQLPVGEVLHLRVDVLGGATLAALELTGP